MSLHSKDICQHRSDTKAEAPCAMLAPQKCEMLAQALHLQKEFTKASSLWDKLG